MSRCTMRPCGPEPASARKVELALARQPAGERRGEDAPAAVALFAGAGSTGWLRRLCRGRLLPLCGACFGGRRRRPSRQASACAARRPRPCAFVLLRLRRAPAALASSPSPASTAITSLTGTSVRPFRHDDLRDRALVDRLDLHRRLVGLDLGDHVAGGDLVALLDVPLGEIALLHRGRQRGHEDVDRHYRSPA